jgi:hypothetical protein
LKKFNNRPNIGFNHMPMKMVPEYYNMWKCLFRLEDSFDYCLFLVCKWQTQTDKAVLDTLQSQALKTERVQRCTIEFDLTCAPVSLNPEPFQDVTGSQPGTIPLSHHSCKTHFWV